MANGASRRTVLSILGLASIATPAAAEFAQQTTPRDSAGGFVFGIAANAATAKALRRMAEEIEAGNMAVTNVEIRSRLRPDEFLEHDFSLRFAMKEGPTS